MGRTYRQNYKIIAGKGPSVADETGEVLTFGETSLGALPTGNLVGGPGVSVVASGTNLIFISTSTGSSGVMGPSPSTDRGVATYNGTGGTTLRNTNVIITATDLVQLPSGGGVENQGVVINSLKIFTSSPSNILASNYYCLINASGAITINLPSNPLVGQSHVIKDAFGDGATFAKTITPASGLVDGQASTTLAGNFAAKMVTFTGTQWAVF